MYFLDLFSGIGGFALGAYWAGWRFDKHYFSEINKYCCDLYQLRFPEAIPLGDITKIERLPEGEYIITGGFPCQPFSIAGKRKGEKDERNLWPEMFRIIRLCKPLWVVAENVPGVAPYIKRMVKPDLESEGYEVWPFSISARTMGAPHKRERIWIIANSRIKRWARPIRSNFRGFKEKIQKTNALDTQGNPFLQFEKRVGESAVFRMDDGLPNRMDRLKALGNSIVPQIAELLFRQIKEIV